MSSARYAPLPNPRTPADAEREMHEAFELDDEDDDDTHSESAPLNKAYKKNDAIHGERPQLAVATDGGPATYDFEREYDYDYPPPGSPPDASSARPNDIGNSNGVLPSTPVRPNPARPTFFRRVVGALLPQHYQQIPTEPASQHGVGGGLDNDGVFANVTAKPGRAVQVQAEDGSVYMVPEETQGQAPPSYSEAQADAVPQYWETTVHAPSSLDPNADMIVDDLPTGSWYLFAANVFISWFFQFIGFLFTYLLHTTHAAKYGSRVGLGLTLIQFGFYSRRQNNLDEVGDVVAGASWNNMTSEVPKITHGTMGTTMLPNGTIVEVDLEAYDLTSRDWVSFLLMTLGWFLLLSSLAGFFRVKRWERSIRSASPQPVVERIVETPQVTGPYPGLFGFDLENEHDLRDESQMTEAEVRLARDLRAAGLI